MKKMSLKNAKTLSRKEMRSIAGGYGVNPGYFYNGHDCWIYGTWYNGSNGQSLFVPGSAVNQFLNNVCGWGNVG